jgi:hypothetical protein
LRPIKLRFCTIQGPFNKSEELIIGHVRLAVRDLYVQELRHLYNARARVVFRAIKKELRDQYAHAREGVVFRAIKKGSTSLNE